MRKYLPYFIALAVVALFGLSTQAMTDSPDKKEAVIANQNSDEAVVAYVKAALKSGSSKELTKHFNDMVELNLDGEKSNYSKSQAEFVLREFFRKNPPLDFQYIHQGASKEGLRYAIGKYTYRSGSFRVYMLLKQFNDGVYLIDTLDLSKE